MTRFAISIIAVLGCVTFAASAEVCDLNLLFLGDRDIISLQWFAQLQPVLVSRSVKLTYTENVGDLNPATLAKYDGLIVYANIDEIEPAQETVLLEYVATGHGFIPLHCASFCFRNSPKYVELVGGQFQRHGKGGDAHRDRPARP